MVYKEFKNILNKQIFESSKRILLEKIAENPERYVGSFRPTKPKAKILQNLLQSNEIRFGDALEVLFKKYFEECGFKNLENKIKNGKDDLDLDQFFENKEYTYFMEQKVRDDHDSTKKRGQIKNFETKISVLLRKYNKSNLKCFMYFIDPCLMKNKNYYMEEITKLKNDYNVYIKLCYGDEFWHEIGYKNVWEELLHYLEKWKIELPEMPSINFDEHAEKSFEEIKNIEIPLFRKLFKNKKICSEILPILFPQKKVLKLLREHFKLFSDTSSIHKFLFIKIEEIITDNEKQLRQSESGSGEQVAG
jgi:hypothetical protein